MASPRPPEIPALPHAETVHTVDSIPSPDRLDHVLQFGHAPPPSRSCSVRIRLPHSSATSSAFSDSDSPRLRLANALQNGPAAHALHHPNHLHAQVPPSPLITPTQARVPAQTLPTQARVTTAGGVVSPTPTSPFVPSPPPASLRTRARAGWVGSASSFRGRVGWGWGGVHDHLQVHERCAPLVHPPPLLPHARARMPPLHARHGAVVRRLARQGRGRWEGQDASSALAPSPQIQTRPDYQRSVKYTPPPAAGPSVTPSSPPHTFQVPAHAQQQQQRPVQLKRSVREGGVSRARTRGPPRPPHAVYNHVVAPASRLPPLWLRPAALRPFCPCVRLPRHCHAAPHLTTVSASPASVPPPASAPPWPLPQLGVHVPSCPHAAAVPSRHAPPGPSRRTHAGCLPCPFSVQTSRRHAATLPSICSAPLSICSCPLYLRPPLQRQRPPLVSALSRPVPCTSHPHPPCHCPCSTRLSCRTAAPRPLRMPVQPPTLLPHVPSPPVPAFGASTVATLSNRLRAPTTASTPTTPYPLPSPAALPAPAAARTTSPSSSLAAVLPAHLMNIYANPILHATSPRHRLPAGALPDCIQHRSVHSPSSPRLPYVRLTRAETYTPPPAAGRSVPPQSLPHVFQAPAHAQQQQRPMEFKRSVSAMGVYHAHEHKDHPRARASLHHTAVDAWLADHALAHAARRPPALVRTSATSTDGTFKRLHRRTMTLMLEPEPTPVFHLLHLCPSRIRPLLSVVTYNKVSVLPPPSTNRIVGLDMRAPSSLTFGSRSSKASGEDTATLRAHTDGLPPVFTCHSRNHSSLLPDAPSLKSSQGSAHDVSGYEAQELDASNPNSDIPYEIIERVRGWDVDPRRCFVYGMKGSETEEDREVDMISCHSTSPSHYNIPKPAATLPGPLRHPPARKASTTPTVLTVFPTFAHTCP
ncbi:hypothetical protein B0H14DRAFT_3508210 [Mycena olivaceomarginata]|nr:hypothetical protein B0H14DRAFT_3508210 [Mycena olivaceomarginata]